MENKKAAQSPHISEAPNDSILKHTHQHINNSSQQQLRLLQYGLKLPNIQHPALNQSHHHQQLNSPNVGYTLHQHAQQSIYHHPSSVQAHRHLQAAVPQQQKITANQLHPHMQSNAQHHQQYPRQNQLKLDQPVYQSTENAYNPLNQHNPQIWVPHQPPLHYHQQQQLKIENQQKQNAIAPVPPPVLQAKPKNVERKKVIGGAQHLRSPSAKRPTEAPVTMQGWLYKQGSEGLMLWKKRWFVLSEYCLFYYKGPEEEKLLGSILLPSYKVSVCTPEDKVTKKFAFKLEHANMRTYVLSAESQELMMQWMQVLNAACLLQNHNESSQLPITTASPANSPTESYPYTPSHHAFRTTPIHMHSSSNTTDLSKPSQQELSQYTQPLYANAPPKPRRLNDGSYSSPSPEVSERYLGDIRYVNPQQQQQQQQQYVIPASAKKSPIPMYSINMPQAEYMPKTAHPQQMRRNMYEYDVYSLPQNAERRTPDTYGRSKLNNVVKSRYPGDYEDIYADQAMYKRPVSPLAYTNAKKPNPIAASQIQRTYTPVSIVSPQETFQFPPQPQLRKPAAAIPRPHSADFLEYEFNRQSDRIPASRQQPRPKSSLDINRNTLNDNYFYSEERYAENMRKSAQYLPKVPRYIPKPQKYPPEGENTYPLMRSSTQPINCDNLSANNDSRIKNNQRPVRSRSVLSEGSLEKEVDFRSSPHQEFMGQSVSPVVFPNRQDQYGYSQDIRRREYDQFTRSASARLAPSTHHAEQAIEGKNINKEGEKKREESMKRLLEWKQRMLQSPLNRKVHQGTTAKIRPDNYYRTFDNGYQTAIHVDPYANAQKSAHALPQYNSYSSDDEENEGRSKENVQTQAGWTLDTFPSVSESRTAAHTTSTTVYNSLKAPGDTGAQNNHQNAPKNDPDTLTKPLKLFNKEHSYIAQVSSLRSEYSEKFEPSPAITEIKSNGALVKSILAEFEKNTASGNAKDSKNSHPKQKNIENIIEENYMSMTPRKNILEPHQSSSPFGNAVVRALHLDLEENPYMDMTNAPDMNVLNNDSHIGENQPYEIVCFSNEKILEPVYMELNHRHLNILNDSSVSNINDVSKPNELPDIVAPSKDKKGVDSKSDSSDADDEASKDLDSLDTPSHPRFSLSDSFRPASYYLGASQTTPEFQDSSDSELVSPPPIPTTPPPLNDLEQDESLTDQTNKRENSQKNYPNTLSDNLQDNDTSSVCTMNTDVENKYSDAEICIPAAEYELKCEELKLYQNRTMRVSDCDIHKRSSSLDGSINSKSIRTEAASKAFNQAYHDYENLYVAEQSSSCKSDRNKTNIMSPSCHTRENSRDNTSASFGGAHSTLSYDDFVQRAAQADNTDNASTCAEIASILHASACSTPTATTEPPREVQSVSLYFQQQKEDGSNSSFNQPAPYYYSDLSMNTTHTDNSTAMLMLNNQREAMNGNKRDITHIVNPIRCNRQARNLMHSPHRSNASDTTFKLAAEARSVSVDFLNLADKSGQIDKKNIYESDTLKRLKTMDSVSSLQSNPETRNIYPSRNNEKFNTNETSSVIITNETNVRRSHSLEGLLENVLSETYQTEDANVAINEQNPESRNSDVTEGSYLWEEDSVWHERLRSASQRHTKSLDDLDSVCEPKKKPPRGITRLVTYVNDNIYNMPVTDKQQKGADDDEKMSTNETKNKENSFIIDREKLRQWDLLSSAPADGQLSVQSQGFRVNNTVVENGDGVNVCPQIDQGKTQEQASGSVSLNARDTFPRSLSSSTKRGWVPNSQNLQNRSPGSIIKGHENDYGTSRLLPQYYATPGSNQQHDPDSYQLNNIRKGKWQWNDRMNVSAGELLGRTHEELVLLLIQLRRQSTNTCHAIEACYNEIDSIQAQLHLMDQVKKLENLQKLEQIKQHLIELEKQYEKGKPLVNLVDNMVKLGSLYRSPNDRLNPYVRERLEFNQQIQERRLLAEERRDWNRLNPNHSQLQEKVQELYQLDRLIQEESSTLQNLQQDKEDIERALGDLRQRINKGFNDPAEIDQARKQQAMLENELTRVHSMLAENSKKLEETVAGNARLEQKLLVLKQKLQIARQQRSSPQFSNPGDSLPCFVGSSAMLESDLQRVQQKVGDLQRQRKELSMQVRQLTDRSNNLQQQIKPFSSASQANQGKKKMHSLWRETDLDTMSIVDHGESWESSLNSSTAPLYINTDLKQNPSEADIYGRSMKSSDSTSDDTLQNSSGHTEKQEIKTVRIVKRESERRQRDREKTVTGKWDPLFEEDDSSQSSSVLFCPTSIQKTQSTTNLGSTSPESSSLNRNNSVSSPSVQAYSSAEESAGKTPELSPVFKSEAARQIITEMSSTSVQDPAVPKNLNRRAVPKEKRRHYTAPHNNLIMKSLNELPTDDSAFDKALTNSKRARDDLDMERALRQRIDAPDVVRSTLSNKELKYNENTIDNILGTPNKISIPERYIPEQLPQLSAEEQEHRLRKVESIKKMLSDTIISSNAVNLNTDDSSSEKATNSIANKATSKMIEEKKQREHLLQLNQILAKQVMEMSKIVAVKALATLPLQNQQPSTEEEDLSPVTPLPLYQQRDNFYS